jgi:phage terminase large subunit
MITQVFNQIYEDVFTTSARYIDLFGGRGRGGSYFVTDYFLFLITQPNYFRGLFMRDVLSDVRISLFQEFKDRINENDTINEDLFQINESSMTITYLPTNNQIFAKGFKKSSGKATAKMKSLAGFTHIAIEECEEVSKEDFTNLDASLRTTKGQIQIFRVFNPPPKNHWLIKDYYNLEPSDVEGYFIAKPKQKFSEQLLSIFGTYKDNIDNINSTTINLYEAYKIENEEYYYTMICGLIPEGVRGRIFKNWVFVKSMPNLYQKFYGGDFGYSNDPTCVCEIERHNKNIWTDELIYETDMTNPDIAKRLIDFGVSASSPVYLDSAEPKSIEELRRLGINALPAEKGQDSVKNGISFLKNFTIHLVETASNANFEYENYSYALDRFKNPTNEPADKYNHFMDAFRYGVNTHLKNSITPSTQRSTGHPKKKISKFANV